MNKDNAHLYLPLVQALAEGKKVEYKDVDGDWITPREISFYADPDRYRVKPEPIVMWANVYEGYVACHETRENAENSARNTLIKCVKLVEEV